MTPSDPTDPKVLGIIVGHGDLPDALLGAATAIVGPQSGISTLSNRDLSAADLQARLEQLIGMGNGAATVVFVDMYGSSCSTVSLRMKRSYPNLAVICGANLPMLVRFINHRGRDSFPELVELVRQARANDSGPGPS